MPVKSALRQIELENALEMMNAALIQAQEASDSLRHYHDTLAQNPERLHDIEQRLSDIYDTARKYKVLPSALLALSESVDAALSSLQSSDEIIDRLKEKEEPACNTHSISHHTDKKRIAAKNILAKQVEEQIHGLGMPNAHFFINCQPLIKYQLTALKTSNTRSPLVQDNQRTLFAKSLLVVNYLGSV